MRTWRVLVIKVGLVWACAILRFASVAHAASYTAASCNWTDVNAVVNGPTHVAVNGDTIVIPAGSCTWSSGIIVPNGIGITITGTGTPNSTAATMGASASCTGTTINLAGATAFWVRPSYGNAATRISCLQLIYGSGGNVGVKALGACTASGCPNLRVDNVTFTNWFGHANEGGIGYAINVIGNMFGVLDHNTVSGGPPTGNYLQLAQISHASYLGIGHWGDNAWAQPEDYGSEKFLFFENNAFSNVSVTESEASAGSLEDAGGGRLVARFNQFTNMDRYNGAAYWHGTESYGRPRGVRAFEFYQNTHACGDGTYACAPMIGARSGTGLAWGNTTVSGKGVITLLGVQTYRTFQNIGGWGACDGASPYDTNDGVTYWSGTIQSVSGSNPYTITVSGSPGWSANQWVSAGSPYSVHDSTINNGSEITASGANTLTVSAWTSIAYAAGHTLQIFRASVCLDPAGGRGAGVLYDDVYPATKNGVAVPANQVLSPIYLWANTFHVAPYYYVYTNTARVIRNREYYGENINQTAQTSKTSPFNGTTTIGLGHGTIANRPDTCTPRVGYWATDQGAWNQSGSGGQGQLYVCTATNTWTLHYTPYTYPHPLTSADTISPSAPTNLQVN